MKKIFSHLFILISILTIIIPLLYVLWIIFDLKNNPMVLDPSLPTLDEVISMQTSKAMLISFYFIYLLPIVFIPISYFTLRIASFLSIDQGLSAKLKKACKIFSIFIIVEFLALIVTNLFIGSNNLDGIPSLLNVEELIVIILYTFPIWITAILSVIFLFKRKKRKKGTVLHLRQGYGGQVF